MMNPKELKECEDEYVDFFNKMVKKYGIENAIINSAKLSMDVLDELAETKGDDMLYGLIISEWSSRLVYNMLNNSEENKEPDEEDAELINKFSEDVKDVFGDKK